MKTIPGFQDEMKVHAAGPEMTVPVQDAVPKGVPSLVRVRFSGGCALTYYNERYDLHPGDMVYVSGKYAGWLGTVETVSTKFRIRRSDYETVLRRLDLSIHGTYIPAGPDYMLSLDPEAVNHEQIRDWVKAPENPEERLWYISGETGAPAGYLAKIREDDIIVGEGWELGLSDLAACPDVTEKIMERGKKYAREHRVKYLTLRRGAGSAWVEGGNWYDLQFRLSGDDVTELYCTCPYPGLCKHAVAALLTLRELLGLPELENCTDLPELTAMENEFFWGALARKRPRITM